MRRVLNKFFNESDTNRNNVNRIFVGGGHSNKGENYVIIDSNTNSKNISVNWYYKIWADLLSTSKSLPENKKSWKYVCLFMVSLTMAANLWLISFISLVNFKFKPSFFPIEIEVTKIEKIDDFLSFFISYILPFVVINYILIFHKNKYKRLIEKYPSNNGTLFKKYFVGSFVAILSYFFIVFILVKVIGLNI